ncbi:MAG: gamma-glutamyltransferase [Methylococcaceae bacterium]|jgi:gamma-glutamyltranspeptidase/glutathione hydrolase
MKPGLVKVIIVLLLGASAGAEAKTAIASAHPLATAAGFEVLDKGGNVFDAAVAVAAALAVVEPSGSGMGGGGLWLLHQAGENADVMIDGREKAPLAAHKAMFLDGEGHVIPQLAREGALSAAIPGLPAALVHLAKHYGRLALADSLAPAIRYARYGFAIGEMHRHFLAFREGLLTKSPDAAAIFLQAGHVPEYKALLRQTDLANTLRQLADFGHEGFYQGEVAEKLVHGVKQAGGIWTLQDLAQYQIVERKPVTGEYQGLKITSAALPSSGGIILVEVLNILAGYDLAHTDLITRKHLIIEAFRRAYHDRALLLGDADFIQVPIAQLLSQDYAAGLRSSIRFDQALPSAALSGEVQSSEEGQNTSHYSIIDDQGNRVAATVSINFAFGSGLVPAGTGVLLNNHMDDFASKVGAANGYGLVGGVANAIEPGKRMLSSMTPTFLETSQHIAVLGTPGGSRIPSMVILAALAMVEGEVDPQAWVSLPRFHHQYLPDLVEYEKNALNEEAIKALSAKGHTLKETSRHYGNMQAVVLAKTSLVLSAASDPRGEGLAQVKALKSTD